MDTDIIKLINYLKALRMTDRTIGDSVGLCSDAIRKLRTGWTPTTNHIAWERLKELAQANGYPIK